MKRRLLIGVLTLAVVAGSVVGWRHSPGARGAIRACLCVIGGFEPKRDLEMLCAAFEAANTRRAGRQIGPMSQEEARGVLQDLITVQGKLCDPEIISALAAYLAAAPDQRSRFLKTAAVAKGLPDWSCAAADELSANWK